MIAGRDIYVFDAYGTVFDVHSAIRRVSSPEMDLERLSGLWRTKQLEYTWIETLMGRHSDFWALTERALDYALAVLKAEPGNLRDQLLDAYRILDVFPEVPDVLTRLKERGARTAILSNATPAMLAQAVKVAGIAPLLDAILSVEEVGLYKPTPAVYGLVDLHFGAKPWQVSFQSSNGWDAAGAAAFGFRVVWVNRGGLPREYAAAGPVIEVPTLLDLVEGFQSNSPG